MPTLLDPPSGTRELRPLAVPRLGVPEIQWIPLLCSGIPAILEILWLGCLVFSAILHLPCEWLNQTVPAAGNPERLGLSGITTHQTRATLATSLLNNGAPAALVCQLLGHVSEQALAHYAKSTMPT
jgi:hypothetical protein